MRPTLSCEAGAGYDFSAAVQADLTIDGFDVTGVECVTCEDPPCTAVATACASDGEAYSVAGCRCAAPAPVAAPATCENVECQTQCHQLREYAMEPPDCCACVTGDTLGLRAAADWYSECESCGTIVVVILVFCAIGAGAAVLGSE
eukprot:COSAG02_NODE_1528_length_12089_cov_21.637698_6_plen_146_part_00